MTIQNFERLKERVNRIETMILGIYERLQALEIDNVKIKAAVQRKVLV